MIVNIYVSEFLQAIVSKVVFLRLEFFAPHMEWWNIVLTRKYSTGLIRSPSFIIFQPVYNFYNKASHEAEAYKDP